MSKSSWNRVKEEMRAVETMFKTPRHGDIILGKTDTEIVDIISRRLSLTYITAWRRLNRYRLYQKAVVLNNKEDINRLGWN